MGIDRGKVKRQTCAADGIYGDVSSAASANPAMHSMHHFALSFGYETTHWSKNEVSIQCIQQHSM